MRIIIGAKMGVFIGSAIIAFGAFWGMYLGLSPSSPDAPEPCFEWAEVISSRTAARRCDHLDHTMTVESERGDDRYLVRCTCPRTPSKAGGRP